MQLTIPDELLAQSQLSNQVFRRELSVFLLEKLHCSLEQVVQITDIPLADFKVTLEQGNTVPSSQFKKLNQLQNRNCVIGNADDLVHNDWSSAWQPPFI